MKGLHWWTLIVGYLVGSFFGVSQIIALISGMFGQKKQMPAAA